MRVSLSLRESLVASSRGRRCRSVWRGTRRWCQSSCSSWLIDSSHGITSVFLLFKHMAPTKLTSIDGSAMSSNADFRSPESEASRRRCETSPLQNDAGETASMGLVTTSMGLVTDQWGGSLVWWLIGGKGGDLWSDLLCGFRIAWLVGWLGSLLLWVSNLLEVGLLGSTCFLWVWVFFDWIGSVVFLDWFGTLGL